jgi:hypothetical protein
MGIVKLAGHQQSSPGALCLAMLNGMHNMYLHHLVDALHLLVSKACWCTWWAKVSETCWDSIAAAPQVGSWWACHA